MMWASKTTKVPETIVKYLAFIISIIILSTITNCFLIPDRNQGSPLPDRLSGIPDGAVKMLPENDLFPPVLHSDKWDHPVPMPGPINSAGGEDSVFINL